MTIPGPQPPRDHLETLAAVGGAWFERPVTLKSSPTHSRTGPKLGKFAQSSQTLPRLANAGHARPALLSSLTRHHLPWISSAVCPKQLAEVAMPEPHSRHTGHCRILINTPFLGGRRGCNPIPTNLVEAVRAGLKDSVSVWRTKSFVLTQGFLHNPPRIAQGFR